MDRYSFLTTAASAAVLGPHAASMAVAGSSNATVPDRVLRNPILGEVARFDGATAPANWAFCDGRILAIAAYPRLFALLGKSHGGDGRTTFALPRIAWARSIIAINGVIPSSPAALASLRRGEDSPPDVSIPGFRVVARPASRPAILERPEQFPLAWPGTKPTAALFAEQDRARHGLRVTKTLHYSGSPNALVRTPD